MSARPEFTQLRYDVADHVATIRFNRAERMNALTRVMEQELYDAMQAADKDEAVRVIVLTGEGRAFCAGMDMAELAELPADDIYDPSRMRAFDTRARPDFQGRYNYFPALAKPVIAAINGAAAGLGLIYALCADMRFASNGAAFSTAFSRRGLIGEHGAAWLLTHTVGPGEGLCRGTGQCGFAALAARHQAAALGLALPDPFGSTAAGQCGNGRELSQRRLHRGRGAFCREAAGALYRPVTASARAGTTGRHNLQGGRQWPEKSSFHAR